MTDTDIPQRIATLPKNEAGYPVPFFVMYVDGKPDFRVIDTMKLHKCIRRELCWICGGRLGAYRAFVIGPMCAVNRISSEPPSHKECAVYAAKTCPFLVKPDMHRRDNKLPDGVQAPPGIHLERNPGVALVWITREYGSKSVDGGLLFTLGDPVATLWFKHGVPATREAVYESILSGLPELEKLALDDGEKAVKALKRQTDEAMKYLPQL